MQRVVGNDGHVLLAVAPRVGHRVGVDGVRELHIVAQDTTYYGLKVMSWLGIVKDLRTPPDRVRRPEREPDSALESV